MLITISFGAFLATLLGGLFALKFKDKLHLILGFSAGAVIGVAFFDLIPEAIELGSKAYSISFITSLSALGFFVYMVLDRFVMFHNHTHEEDYGGATSRGVIGAWSLSLHSFLDGVAIGLAFHVSTAVGIVIAIAVLVHDFSDGINTVNLIIKNKGDKKQAFRWLIVDSCAPVVGILSTFLFILSESALGVALALFAGFFLYIGASDLLPESHHSHPTIWTSVATILGVAVLYGAITLAQI